MKKGFTLIELLAVIVILAIIAIIAVPIVINIIDDFRVSANKNSIDMYAKAIQNSLANYMLTENKKASSLKGTYTSTTLQKIEGLKLEYKGDVECEVIKIYDDLSIYLSDCKNNGDLVYTDSDKSTIYSYGKNLNMLQIADEGTLLSKIGEYYTDVFSIKYKEIKNEPTESLYGDTIYCSDTYEFNSMTGKYNLTGDLVQLTASDTSACNGKYTLNSKNKTTTSSTMYKIDKFVPYVIKETEMLKEFYYGDTYSKFGSSYVYDEFTGTVSADGDVISGKGIASICSKTSCPYSGYYRASAKVAYKILSFIKETGMNAQYNVVEYKKSDDSGLTLSEKWTSEKIKGLYETVDDYGETLVFHGNVDNNYVKFANILWRIVRINGDGTIRLITANGVGTSEFCGKSSTSFEYPSYAQAAYTSNRVNGSIGDNSTIKKYVDDWYDDKLSSFDMYIKIAQYCQPINYDISKLESMGDYDSPWGSYSIYNEDNIKCLGTNTDFGGEYQLKVGLLNYSEFYFSKEAIAIDSPYWIMQAGYYHDYSARIDLYDQGPFEGDVYACGATTTYTSDYSTTINIQVRPVINLKEDVKYKTGNGTISTPYEIVIN